MRRVLAKVANLALAVRGQRADRNQPRLQAGDKTEHQFVAIAKLEDDPVQRLQAHAQEGRAQPVGDGIKFGIGHLTFAAPERQARGMLCKRRTEGFGHGLTGEYSGVKVAAQVCRRGVDDARKGFTHLRLEAGWAGWHV